MVVPVVPTTVFSPDEYACVGLSEAEATDAWGADGVEAGLAEWTTLERALPPADANDRERDPDPAPNCLAKVVTRSDGRIVGLHLVAPNAGETVQGFALAMALGATKQDLDRILGVHPTDAEALCQGNLRVSRRSGADWVNATGCGGECG